MSYSMVLSTSRCGSEGTSSLSPRVREGPAPGHLCSGPTKLGEEQRLGTGSTTWAKKDSDQSSLKTSKRQRNRSLSASTTRTHESELSLQQRANRNIGGFAGHYELTGKAHGISVCQDVKMATSRKTGKKVVVKGYSLSELSKERKADLVQEIQIQSSLDHPNIARLEDAYASQNKMCLVIEHMEGGDVFEHFVGERVFSEQAATRVVRRLLRAVEHLHEKGFVHRDIKPENVAYLSSDREEIKLTDFGLCTQWQEGDPPLTMRCGTENYMAPEVHRGKRYTNKADMWSVGVLAHVLLTHDIVGRRPGHSPRLSPGLCKCSMEAQEFVAALLRIDPGARLTATQALEHPWLKRGSRFQGCLSACVERDAPEPKKEEGGSTRRVFTAPDLGVGRKVKAFVSYLRPTRTTSRVSPESQTGGSLEGADPVVPGCP